VLPQIKPEHIGAGVHPGSEGTECVLLPRRHVISARPCSTISECACHYSSPCRTAAHGADGVRRTPRCGRGIPCESRDRKRSLAIPKSNRHKSSIAYQHHVILSQLPARFEFTTGTIAESGGPLCFAYQPSVVRAGPVRPSPNDLACRGTPNRS
jgi:hypothetical protein